MNSICKPQPKVGLITINNLKGGEINMDQIIPLRAYSAPLESLSLFSNQDLRKLIDEINEEIKELPKRYHVKNGIVKEVKDFDTSIYEKRQALEERRSVCFKIINRRKRKSFSRKRIILSVESEIQYKIESTSMNRGVCKNFIYEMKKGDKMKNEIHKGYVDRKGIYHPDVITKECIIPYKREGSIKKKDLLILHRSGRLGMKIKGKLGIKITSQYNLPDDEETILELFKMAQKSGNEFFVILPKGGPRKKEYGEIPMPITRYHVKGNIVVPLNRVVRKIYKPEIDGKTPIAKDIINEYRGSTEGYGPVYQYDEQNHERDFVPELLSYNYVEYSEKLIILLGTKERIEYIDNRIKAKNSIKNGFHNFIKDQKIVGYNGQKSRCENKRIVSDEDGVRVFGLNLKGTPEENLKGYLRSLDRVPFRNYEEVKELIEIAQETDGRQTQKNIEFDIRRELKHLKSRTSKELYFLILGVEEEVSLQLNKVTLLSTIPGYIEMLGMDVYKAGLKELHNPSKKEQALIEVLKSFKSSKEIEEQEGIGLSGDIEDLIRIEENANDSSYKKSKNLFSQQLGVLSRNQNPLKMDGGFEISKPWTIKGGPISFPRNEKLPKRNIPFVKRSSRKTLPIYIPGIFDRRIEYSVQTKKVRTEKGFVSEEIGVKVEYPPLFFSSCNRKYCPIDSMFEYIVDPYYIPYIQEKKQDIKKPNINGFNLIRFVLSHPLNDGFILELRKKVKETLKREAEEEMNKKLSITPPKQRIPHTITGLKLPEGKFEYKERVSSLKKYILNKGCIPTVRLFDDKTRIGTVWKKVTPKQFLASEQKPYQFSGKIVFEEKGVVKMEDGSEIKTGEFVRTPHNHPSSFKILHTIGDGKGKVDYYIIEINGQVLYAKGDVSLLEWNKESISFTGTRTPSRMTKKFVRETINMFLKDDDYVTISGGAEGCDTIVHTSTIQNGGKTIIVLAGGFDGQYVKKGQINPDLVLKKGGLLLSEHPPKYCPSKGDFIKRNKIIASLSTRLVVFEAGNGTMHCANFGKELGKELLIQPGFKRNQTLIESGIGVQLIPIEGSYPF